MNKESFEKLVKDVQESDIIIPINQVADLVGAFFEYIINQEEDQEIAEIRDLYGKPTFSKLFNKLFAQFLLDLYVCFKFDNEEDIDEYLGEIGIKTIFTGEA